MFALTHSLSADSITAPLGRDLRLTFRYSSSMSRAVIAIPHAATALPEELRPRLADHVNENYLRRFSDVDTDKTYSLPNVRTVRFGWSRYLVDPNRAEHQMSSGGVVPIDCFDLRSLYRPGHEPSDDERRMRVAQYHRPYHLEVNEAIQQKETAFFIDGHSMAGVAPPRTLNPGELRPDAVISNLGNSNGNPAPGTPFLTCPPDLCRFAAQRLAHWMREIPIPEGPEANALQGQVNLNTPFPGGYGVRTHASPSRGIPGVQLELNQKLWVDEATFIEIPGRIEWMRTVLTHWIDDVVERRLSEP